MEQFTEEQLNELTQETEEELPTLQRALEMLDFQEGLKKQLEHEVKEASERINHLRRATIPSIMAESGLESAVMDGIEVKVTTAITCSMPRERAAQCVEWLREHGHGGIVKSNLVFPGDNDSIKDAIAAAGISDYGLEETKVHPSTLKSWATEILSNGGEIPTDLFKVDSYTWTTTKPKRK